MTDSGLRKMSKKALYGMVSFKSKSTAQKFVNYWNTHHKEFGFAYCDFEKEYDEISVYFDKDTIERLEQKFPGSNILSSDDPWHLFLVNIADKLFSTKKPNMNWHNPSQGLSFFRDRYAFCEAVINNQLASVSALEEMNISDMRNLLYKAGIKEVNGMRV